MEDVVPHIVSLRILGSQNESLHEPSHWLPVVRELSGNLNDDTIAQCFMGVHLLQKENKINKNHT